MRTKSLHLSAEVWREGDMYTAYCRELDIASCGTSIEEAWGNLREAFDIFLQEARRKGTLQELLEEAGLTELDDRIERPEHFIGHLELPLPG